MEDNTRSILGLSASHVVNDIYSPVLPAILPLLILQNGYSYFLAGLLVTVYNLTSSFTQPFIGWLYDNKGISIPVPVSIMFCAFFMSPLPVETKPPILPSASQIALCVHATQMRLPLRQIVSFSEVTNFSE